jgi:hypothetical protein
MIWHLLSVLGRTLARIVAAVAFYLALFLCEDEEKRLRDRVQDRIAFL